VLITQCPLAHIRQLDGSLRASIHKPVTTGRVEFGRGDNFGEFFHVGRFDIDNVETLVLDVEVPEVNPEIITTYEGLSVTVDGDAVDVVCMGVCICPPRYGCDNSIVVCHPGKLQRRRVLERYTRWTRRPSTRHSARGREFVRQVVLGDDLE